MNQNHQEEEQSQDLKLLRSLGYRNEPNSLARLSKYSKILGNHLMAGLNRVMETFKKNLFKLENQEVSNQNEEEQQKGEQQNNHPKRVGFKVNFRQFNLSDSQIEALEIAKVEQKKDKKPARAFAFNMQDINADGGDDSESEDLARFLTRIGSKKVKTENTKTRDDKIVEIVLKETPKTKKHFADLHNRVIQDFALEMIENKEKLMEERRKDKKYDEFEENYSKYLNSINQNFITKSQGYENPKTRLSNLKRSARERQQQKPKRKMTNNQKQTPQIYNVEKVLEILEMQSNQFVNEKIKKRQEEIRIEQEAKRVQLENIQRQRIIEEEKQKEKRRQEEKSKEQEKKQREKEEEENKEKQGEESRIQVKKKQSDKGQLEVIVESQQFIEENSGQLSFEQMTQKKSRKNQISPKSIELSSPHKSENVEVKPIEKELKTPQKDKVESILENKQKVAPPEQKNNSAQSKNPFLRSSPVVVPAILDFIQAETIKQPQTIFNPAPSSNIFTQNNIFGKASEQTSPSKQVQNMQDQLSVPNPFTSPHPQPAPPIQQSPNQQNMFAVPQYSPQGSMVNNPSSIFPGSGMGTFENHTGSFNMGQMESQRSQPLHNPPSGLGSAFEPGNNLSQMFSSNTNVFMQPSQPKSLFGDPPPTTSSYSVPRGINRKKVQRITQ